MDDILIENTPNIDKLEKSTILLIILSRGYLNSKRCLSELENFLKLKTESGRVFIVERDKVQPPTNLLELISHNNHKFWLYGSNSAYTLEMPQSNYEGREYYQKIAFLAKKLTDKLKELKTQSSFSPSNDETKTENTVFLAEVTDDLDEYREQFKQLLEQQGYEVLPQRSYLLSDKCQLHGYNEDIKKSIAFVQFLSDTEGKPECPYPLLQYQYAKTTGKPILQWRNKSLKVEKVTNDEHRTLLELDTVMAIGIEEFRHEVLEVLQAIKQPPTQIARAPQQHLSSFWIFVNAIQADESFAIKLMDIFAKQNVLCISSISKGEPRTLRQVREQRMRDCDTMVVVYGQSELDWVDAQFSDLVKFSRQSGQPCLLPGAVCEAPPLPKQRNINIKWFFRCTEKSLEENIDNFLDELRTHAS